jgi:hypothetical protein
LEKIKNLMKSQLKDGARIIAVGVCPTSFSAMRVHCAASDFRSLASSASSFAYPPPFLPQFKMKGWEADWVDRIKGLPVYVYTWPKPC